MDVILSTAYIPPIIYCKNLALNNAIIEGAENFQKQSFRNRCVILTANGKEELIVPVKHYGKTEIPIKEKEISYAENWQLKHWRSITSAYNHSPYFEYYKDEFKEIIMRKEKFLFDLNYQLLSLIVKNLEIKLPLINEVWNRNYINTLDLRNEIHPKIGIENSSKIYMQVFINKFGFTPNLSIIDLLFNVGPDSLLKLLEN
jgi:hypothetical protein